MDRILLLWSQTELPSMSHPRLTNILIPPKLPHAIERRTIRCRVTTLFCY